VKFRHRNSPFSVHSINQSVSFYGTESALIFNDGQFSNMLHKFQLVSSAEDAFHCILIIFNLANGILTTREHSHIPQVVFGVVAATINFFFLLLFAFIVL
jgi:hypothetical protein